MSSHEATATPQAARCLLCSVGCPLRCIRVGPDQYLPDYVPHEGYAGLCGRGSVVVEWLDHPARLKRGRRGRGEEAKDLAPLDAARRLGDLVRAASSAVLVADANLDLDALARVGRLAAEIGARWTVLATPGDAGLVHGVDAALAAGDGPAVVGPEALADADALLLVGDVFAAHPVAAHWVFEARRARPRMSRLVVAGAETATAKFATAWAEPDLRTGGLAEVLSAVRTGRPEALAGPTAGWKDQLASADRPALVLTAPLGYADGRRLAEEAVALAAETGARLCPLTAYGGAWGALRVAAAEGGACPAEVLRPGRDLVVAFGGDPVSSLGAAVASALLSTAGEVAYVGPMPCRTAERATLVVPAAFPFESAGRALLGPGRETTLEPLMPPPAGVPTLAEVLEAVGAPAGTPVEVSSPVSVPMRAGPAGRPAAVAGGTGAGDCKGIAVGLGSDAVHFGDGSLTRQSAWPPSVRPRPVLALAASDAEAAGLPGGGRARLRGPGGVAEVDVVVRQDQRPGQGWVAPALAEVRDAFGWAWDGPAPGTPVCMELEKA